MCKKIQNKDLLYYPDFNKITKAHNVSVNISRMRHTIKKLYLMYTID